MAPPELGNEAWLAGSEGLPVKNGNVCEDFDLQLAMADCSIETELFAKRWQGSRTYVCKLLDKEASNSTTYKEALLWVRCRAPFMPASVRLVLQCRLSAWQELKSQAVLGKHVGLLPLHAVYEEHYSFKALTPFCQQSLAEHLVTLPVLSEQACGSLALQLVSVLCHCHQKGKNMLCSDAPKEHKESTACQSRLASCPSHQAVDACPASCTSHLQCAGQLGLTVLIMCRGSARRHQDQSHCSCWQASETARVG